MLPKTERFTTKELDELRKTNPKTKKLNTLYGFFVIYEGAKKGIVLPKKIFKTAVLRNKLKRLYFNTILEIKKEDVEILNTSFIFHPKKIFTKTELKNSILDILKM